MSRAPALNDPVRADPALWVVAAGVAAALHVAKLAPAIAALQAATGMTLVQAGFLLSGVQLAGMVAGLPLGLLADRIGARRCLIGGLLLLALASAAGGAMTSVAALLALRAVEGLGFLLVVLPAPGLLRRLVAPARSAAMMGLWGSYMPLGTALALLVGPLAVQALGWRAWWWLLAALSALMALLLARAVPAAEAGGAVGSVGSVGAVARAPVNAWATLRHTLASPGPWIVSLAFAAYSGQWLSVVGFLPTLYAQAGVSAGLTGVLTALAAAANIGGNLASGQLLQRGVSPLRLLWLGYAVMALAAALNFGVPALPAWGRYAAVLVFSGVGGLIPGTLFSLALRVAPGEHAVATTVGWMQQWSAAGQFVGPPVVAALAAWAGGWHLTWVFNGACSAGGALLVGALIPALRGRR